MEKELTPEQTQTVPIALLNTDRWSIGATLVLVPY